MNTLENLNLVKIALNSDFWTKNFKVKVDALPHTLSYGPETWYGR